MAFCKACGQVIGGANFCRMCGAGLLCYILGWVTGIIFLLIDKRPFVRFHAAQSIVVFGGLTALRIAVGFLSGLTGFFVWGIFGLVGLLGFVLWILLMIKAYQHELFKVPIAAPIAESIAGK